MKISIDDLKVILDLFEYKTVYGDDGSDFVVYKTSNFTQDEPVNFGTDHTFFDCLELLLFLV